MTEAKICDHAALEPIKGSASGLKLDISSLNVRSDFSTGQERSIALVTNERSLVSPSEIEKGKSRLAAAKATVMAERKPARRKFRIVTAEARRKLALAAARRRTAAGLGLAADRINELSDDDVFGALADLEELESPRSP